MGLGLISAVTGLLTPDVATMVGKLYRTDDERRDAGSALSYRAIDIGAFAGPLTTGRLGDHRGRHGGFSAAALGMTFDLAQYVVGRRHLAGRKHAAEFAPTPAAMRRAIRLIAAGLVSATALATAGWLTMDRFAGPRVTPEERGRLRPYLVLSLASTAFNFILFRAYSTTMPPTWTNAETTILDFDFPAGWYASALAAFEVALAPVVAALWVRTGRSRPHASNKIAIGVVRGGLPFPLMTLPTSGPLWFPSLALANGNGIQAQTVKLYDDVSKPAHFGVNGAIAVAAGLAVRAGPDRGPADAHPYVLPLRVDSRRPLDPARGRDSAVRARVAPRDHQRPPWYADHGNSEGTPTDEHSATELADGVEVVNLLEDQP